MEQKVDLEKCPYAVKSKTLGETVYWARDEAQAEKCKGITYVKKELEYIQNTPKPMNSLKVMHLLKKRGYKVILDPWARAEDTNAWMVILSLVKTRELRQALILLRRAEAVKVSKNSASKRLDIRPLERGEELYRDCRVYLNRNAEELVDVLQKTYKLFFEGNKNNAAQNTAA